MVHLYAGVGRKIIVGAVGWVPCLLNSNVSVRRGGHGIKATHDFVHCMWLPIPLSRGFGLQYKRGFWPSSSSRNSHVYENSHHPD